MPYKSIEKQREFQRVRNAQRRAEFFKDKVCVRCGSGGRLELDHIDRKNKISHNIWSWTRSRMEEEIKKCQVLCYDCHKIKTKEERTSDRQHGRTWYGYGCRCLICYKAKQIQNAKRKRS